MSNPFEITGEQLKKLKEYCYDTDYRYAFEEASIMCQDEVDETLKAADQFWEDIQ